MNKYVPLQNLRNAVQTRDDALEREFASAQEAYLRSMGPELPLLATDKAALSADERALQAELMGEDSSKGFKVSSTTTFIDPTGIIPFDDILSKDMEGPRQAATRSAKRRQKKYLQRPASDPAVIIERDMAEQCKIFGAAKPKHPSVKGFKTSWAGKGPSRHPK